MGPVIDLREEKHGLEAHKDDVARKARNRAEGRRHRLKEQAVIEVVVLLERVGDGLLTQFYSLNAANSFDVWLRLLNANLAFKHKMTDMLQVPCLYRMKRGMGESIECVVYENEEFTVNL